MLRRTGNELRGQRHDTAQGNLLRHGRNRSRLCQDGFQRRTRNHQADDRRRPVRRQAGEASHYPSKFGMPYCFIKNINIKNNTRKGGIQGIA